MALLVYACNTASADVLQGAFTFQNKAPSVALVYFPEDTSLSPVSEVVVDQVNKKFSLKLVIATKGSTIIFRNLDAIKHNIFSRDRKADVKIDLGLSQPGISVDQKVTWEDKIVKFGCKIHPKMRMWVASIASQYYKIVEFAKDAKKANFEMRDIPDHVSTVRIWLPKYPSSEIRLQKGESKDIELYNWGSSSDTLTLVRK